jgi:hypothetical protein
MSGTKSTLPQKNSSGALCLMDFLGLGRQKSLQRLRTGDQSGGNAVVSTAPGRKRAPRDETALRAQGIL